MPTGHYATRDGDTPDIDDPNEYKQKQRQQFILDAFKKVFTQDDKAEDWYKTGQIDEALRQRIYWKAVRDYALMSEHVIQNHLPSEAKDPDNYTPKETVANHVWNDADLGELQMTTRVMDITGIKEFLEIPRTITETWTERSTQTVGGVETTTRTKRWEVPLDMSEAAFRQLNEFWNAMGMDLETETNRPFHDWREDYDDGIYE